MALADRAMSTRDLPATKTVPAAPTRALRAGIARTWVTNAHSRATHFGRTKVSGFELPGYSAQAASGSVVVTANETRTETKQRCPAPSARRLPGIVPGEQRWRRDLNPRQDCAHTRFRGLLPTVRARPPTAF